MKKLFVAIAALALLIPFSSCEKCYDCEDHCVTCNVSGTTITGCSSQGNYVTVKSTCVLTGGTLTETNGIQNQEVCGKPENSEESSAALEVLGYTCAEK
jgi:hypothetical protein